MKRKRIIMMNKPNLSVNFKNITPIELAQRTRRTPKNVARFIAKNIEDITLVSLVEMAQNWGMGVSVELREKKG